jgi:hypothetical protein
MLMARLVTAPNLARHDDLYQAMVDAQHGLDDGQSMQVLARLALLLINHIGDPEIAHEAIQLARRIPPADR